MRNLLLVKYNPEYAFLRFSLGGQLTSTNEFGTRSCRAAWIGWLLSVFIIMPYPIQWISLRITWFGYLGGGTKRKVRHRSCGWGTIY